ncbi:MAG: M20 aminoacylase family protein [Hyphomicrobiales bacterium]
MGVNERIAAIHEEMTAWRRAIHEYPETAFEEHRTSDFVAEKLESFGIEIDRSMAGTGIVGVIKGNQEGDEAIGLRADMDALNMSEKTNKEYHSKIDGKMHACGHDGHTAMLLGAAKYLAETRAFAGTAYVIFQPAEEGGNGAKVMIDEGLFEKYPMSQVHGLHNSPGRPLGEVCASPGPMMAACDLFDIIVSGVGAHAASPQEGTDQIVAGAQLVSQLQTISSRAVDPMDAIVLSITQFHAGDAYNVIPDEVRIAGTVRTFNPEVQKLAIEKMSEIVKGIGTANGVEMELRHNKGCPATVNWEEETAHAADVAAKIVGEEKVLRKVKPEMGSEDFSFMLEEKPGSYIFMGAGDGPGLHNPQYDFNDEMLPIGASYWAALVEETLHR